MHNLGHLILSKSYILGAPTKGSTSLIANKRVLTMEYG